MQESGPQAIANGIFAPGRACRILADVDQPPQGRHVEPPALIIFTEPKQMCQTCNSKLAGQSVACPPCSPVATSRPALGRGGSAAGGEIAAEGCAVRATSPALRRSAATSPGATDSDTLNRLCGYICSRLDDAVSLADLARVSGRTSRSLQYAFRRRFGCTPTAWIRRQRLARAHAELCCPRASTTVTEVAFSCGFNHMGMFARYYRDCFGEAPSTTLTRAMAGQRRGDR